MREKILVADDAIAFARRLQAVMFQRNLAVVIAHTLGEVFDHLASSGPFSLLVLGQTVDGMTAQSVLKTLQKTNRLGEALVLRSEYRINPQGTGVWRDIEQARLVADNIDKMCGRPPAITQVPIRCGPLILNPENHEVRIQDKLLNLSPREIEVFYYFVEHVGELVTREDLLDSVWGGDKTVKSQIVDVYLKRLRALCKAETKELSFRTVSKMGYQFIVRTPNQIFQNQTSMVTD
jgi:DNA-binding response OmpR family regulator